MNTTSPQTRNIVGGVLAGVALAIACVVFIPPACTGTPDQRAANVAKAETDLCKLRAAGRAAEAMLPELAPAQGSARDEIEHAEDALCALRAESDAGAK